MLKSFTAICALMVALGSHAFAVTLDDLKGYSIEVNATRAQVFRPDSDPHIPSSNDIKILHRVYVGLAGNIFDYSKQNAGMYSSEGSHVESLDKAVTISRGRMKAWTVDGGHLTLLIRAPEGFIVQSIAVDPSKSTCTFAETTQRDPTTGRLVVERLNGHTNEVVSFSIASSSCTIKKGNIFAADQ